jgi:putative Holliday junction resolvase
LGRILCLDYGKKRSGVAVTDPLRIIASPLNFLDTRELHSFLDKYFRDEEVSELLIGYPVHHDGTKTYLCAEIDEFLTIFSNKHPLITISKIDESYSSVEAKSLLAEATRKKKKRPLLLFLDDI